MITGVHVLRSGSKLLIFIRDEFNGNSFILAALNVFVRRLSVSSELVDVVVECNVRPVATTPIKHLINLLELNLCPYTRLLPVNS